MLQFTVLLISPKAQDQNEQANWHFVLLKIASLSHSVLSFNRPEQVIVKM